LPHINTVREPADNYKWLRVKQLVKKIFRRNDITDDDAGNNNNCYGMTKRKQHFTVTAFEHNMGNKPYKEEPNKIYSDFILREKCPVDAAFKSKYRKNRSYKNTICTMKEGNQQPV